MKFTFAISILLFTQVAFAEMPFEIPRSSILELKDEGSERTYPIFVKLPRSYTKSSTRKFPVIYLTDSWYSFQIVSGATRFPMNSKQMEEAIIVAISYSKGSRGSSSRVRDYTPIKAKDWKMKTGEASNHLNFIESVVIPYIDSNYRTSKNRTFVGNSLGGLFGAFILFSNPDLFSSYILGSPSVWFADNYLLSMKVSPVSKNTKVYVSVGSLEELGKRKMVSGAESLVNKITTESGAKVNVKFNIIYGARHSTAFPTTAIQGLDWIYGINK